MSDEHEGPSEEDLLMPSDHDDEHMHDDGMDEDHDMDDGIFDHEDDDEDEDEEMDDADIGSMPVHDLHLAEGMAAAAAAAAAAASQAAAAAASDSRAAAEVAAAASRAAEVAATAAAAAGAAGGSDARAPWARSSAAPPPPPAANGAARTAAVVAGAGAGPKLVFYMNEQPLAAECTVFQAIQQSTLAANGGDDDDNGDEAGLGGSGRRGRQLWEQVYTLQYRLAGTEPQEAAAAGPSSRVASGALAGPSRQSSMSRQGSVPPAAAAAAGEAAAAGSDAVSQWRQSPLGELLAVQLPHNLAAPESCLDILRLVQLLEVINRLAPRMLASHELQLLPGAAAAANGKSDKAAAAAGSSQPSTAEEEAVGIAAVQAAAGQMALAHVPRDEFISSKLGNKLAQQLKDVLSICGGGIPAWCHQLVVSCRFLFPFEVRRRYFYSTAFGLGRALHHMHQQQAAEGLGGALERDGRELRIGRLVRQKVRVSRRRILDSAVKVIMIWWSGRGVSSGRHVAGVVAAGAARR
jgi:E3 ubiquitin-protein ligase TRIP12